MANRFQKFNVYCSGSVANSEKFKEIVTNQIQAVTQNISAMADGSQQQQVNAFTKSTLEQQLEVLQQLLGRQVHLEKEIGQPVMQQTNTSMPNLEKLEEKFDIENENGQDIEELSEEVITE